MFKKWLKKQIGTKNLPPWCLDFCEDVRDDKTFPQPQSLETLLGYMRRKGACREALDAATYCYRLWVATDPRATMDGFSPKDKDRVRKATRQVWSWSYPRRLCVARATDKKGFVRCENPDCESEGQPVPRIHVDHVQPVGVIDEGYMERLFVPSRMLQALCGQCHKAKTREDLKAIKKGKTSFYESC